MEHYVAMLQRHSRSVLSVIAAQLRERADDIARHALPPTSLLLVVDSDETSPQVVGLDHSDDYARVTAAGTQYTFTPQQATVVRNLHRAKQRGVESVPASEALAGLTSTKLSDVFKRSPAWGTLIVQTERRGFYRLNLPPKVV